jgi:hypothetical protein
MKLELTLEELAHLSECESCRKLFKICVLTEKPSILDTETEEQADQKTA